MTLTARAEGEINEPGIFVCGPASLMSYAGGRQRHGPQIIAFVCVCILRILLPWPLHSFLPYLHEYRAPWKEAEEQKFRHFSKPF
jgi:hypothetical protein